MTHGASDAVQGALAQAADDADWDALLELLGKNWSQLVDDPGLTHAVLGRVPRNILESNPRWIIARGYLEHVIRGVDSVAYRNVTPDFGSGEVLDELSHLTARIADNWGRGNLAAAVDDVESGRARLDRSLEAEKAALQHGLPHLLPRWARVYEMLDRPDDARALLGEAFDAAELIGDSASARSAASRLSWIEATAGRHAEAATWIGRAEQNAGTPARRDPEWMLAQTLRLADDLQIGAAQQLLDSQDLTRMQTDSWAGLLFVIAHLSDATTAPTALDNLLAAEDARPSGLSRQGANLVLLTHAKVRLLLLNDDAAGALRVTQDLPEHPGLLVPRSAALLAMDQNRAVLEIAQRVRAQVEGRPRWRTTLAAVESVALARIGAEDAAREVARRIVEAVPRLGLFSSLTLLSMYDLEQLLGLVDTGHAGQIRNRVLPYLSARIVVRLSLLSSREREVLKLIVTGNSIEQAAAALFVSKNTIKTQIASIYRKLDVTSRAQLIAVSRTMPLDEDDSTKG